MFSFSRYKTALLLNLIVLAVLLTHSIYRDIQLEKQYPSDLRNRVVGARLQKDGKDPYFYKWKKEDGGRYLDPANYDSLKVSNITASPVFHDLLMPICDLPQRTISILWLCFQYLILALITILFTRLSSSNLQKYLIINFSLLFTCTEAWKLLIANGQIYFFYALLISCTIYGLWKGGKKQNLLLAALSSSLLILLKPTALIIFIPFLIQYKSAYRYMIATFAFLVTYGLFAIINQNEHKSWISYNMAIKEQVKVHQDLNPTLQNNEPLPVINELEGFNFNEVKQNYAQHPISIYSENGNVFVIFRQVLHKTISVNMLLFMFIACILVLSAAFVYLKIKTDIPLASTLLFAFLLYMLAEIFGPVYRHQYNTVQWLPILLTGLLMLNRWRQPAAILIMLGLLLNFSKVSFIPMQHTMGEFCWIFAVILIVFAGEKNNLNVRIS